jgi:hypothetical protein
MGRSVEGAVVTARFPGTRRDHSLAIGTLGAGLAPLKGAERTLGSLWVDPTGLQQPGDDPFGKHPRMSLLFLRHRPS